MMFIWQNVTTTLDPLQKISTSVFEGLGRTKPASGGNSMANPAQRRVKAKLPKLNMGIKVAV